MRARPDSSRTTRALRRLQSERATRSISDSQDLAELDRVGAPCRLELGSVPPSKPRTCLVRTLEEREQRVVRIKGCPDRFVGQERHRASGSLNPGGIVRAKWLIAQTGR